MHQLDVTYENIPVPESPFRVNAVPGCDPKRVRAYGPGLENATTNEPAKFTIETKGAGQGSLGLAIEGPSEAKMVCKDNQDGTCLMEYLPVSVPPSPLDPCRTMLLPSIRRKPVNMILPSSLLSNMCQVILPTICTAKFTYGFFSLCSRLDFSQALHSVSMFAINLTLAESRSR